jgi:hypothetical protein
MFWDSRLKTYSQVLSDAYERLGRPEPITNASPRGSGTLNPASSNNSFIDFSGVGSLLGVSAVFLLCADEFASAVSRCDF